MTIVGNKKKFLSYFLEFLVLFASIYIAFELEEWDEEQDFRDREEAYLASMHQDLSKDLNQLNRRVLDYDEKINSASEILVLLEGSYQSNRSEIFGIYQSQLQYNFNYNPVNNTLETLKTSGDLKLLKNHRFKILLSELGKSYNVTINQGVIFNNYVEGSEWSGFLINNFNMKDLTSISADPNLKVLFQNKIGHYIMLIENYYFYMQGTLKKIEEVKQALEKEMTIRKLSFNPGVSNEEEEDLDLQQVEDSLSIKLDGLLDDLNSDDESQEKSDKNTEIDDFLNGITDDLMNELSNDSLGN